MLHAQRLKPAAALLAEHGCVLGLEYVIRIIHPEHQRSLRLAERLGEHYSGRARVRGYDVLVYRLERAPVSA